MSGRAQPLYGARSLAEWIVSGGRSGRVGGGYRLRLRWHARWFELNWKATTRRIASAPLPDDPVFVLGLWRSGTTVLHELLTACGRWATPRTWQCFNPSTCFLTSPPAEDAVVDRPMDEGRIATRGPQEDEFARLLLGEPSAYRGFIDPRRLGECGRLLWTASEGPLERWQAFVRGIAASSPGTPLLIKSPNHSFRLPLLRRVFPQARFVWIGRDTGEVLASNRRMWGAMIERYALWECPPGALEDFLRDMVRACAAVLARCLEELPAERMLWVDFERLCARPEETLLRVLRFLDPSADGEARDGSQAIGPALARIPIHAGSRAARPDDPDVRELEAAMAAMRRRFAGSDGPPRPLPTRGPGGNV